VVDWGVVCLLAATVLIASQLPLRRGTAVSCHFRGCKAPLSWIVSGAIWSF